MITLQNLEDWEIERADEIWAYDLDENGFYECVHWPPFGSGRTHGSGPRIIQTIDVRIDSTDPSERERLRERVRAVKAKLRSCKF